MRTPSGALRAVSLHGRLGNQLFQFATVRARTDPDLPVVVEAVHAPDHYLVDALRPGALRRTDRRDALALHRLPTPPDRLQFAVGVAQRKAETVAPLRRRLTGRVYDEPSMFRFDPHIDDVEPPVLYRGFFQHEEYFRSAAGEVAGSLRAPTADGDAAFRAIAGDRSTVAVVIRAGVDYARLGWALPLDWFQGAAELVAGAVDRPAFVVFSDVPFAAEATSRLLDPLGPSMAAPALSAVDQLHLAARCHHAIASSSSFAWWAAWLGDVASGFSPDRVVVAPEPWLQAGNETAPARWTPLACDVSGAVPPTGFG